MEMLNFYWIRGYCHYSLYFSELVFIHFHNVYIGGIMYSVGTMYDVQSRYNVWKEIQVSF